MTLILESREIPYNRELTLAALENHANGYLRYQNFSDFISQGPEAVQAYIDRANLLFCRNLKRKFPDEADQIGPLNLSYQSIFFRNERESAGEALPMADFLKFRFRDKQKEKSGFGIFFSFFGRELDREKLESGQRTIRVNTSTLIYQLMFKDLFPDLGVLEGFPIMTMRQVKNGNSNDLLHQYYTQLGAKLRSVQPANCPGVLRCYHHGKWTDIDPKVRTAAISLGQAMQECIRVDEYRRPNDPETQDLPAFKWNHQRQVKDDQARQAHQWFAEHVEDLQEIFRECRLRKRWLQEVKYRA